MPPDDNHFFDLVQWRVINVMFHSRTEYHHLTLYVNSVKLW